MATTKITPEKTVAEIQVLLAQRGAKRILIEYDNGEISAVSFILDYPGFTEREIPFRLPNRWEGCLTAMKEHKRTPRHLCNPAQAKRTAWRIILRWLLSQFAFIDSQMVKTIEVLFPYIQNGEFTLYEMMEKQHFKLLPTPDK
jgi:hypothetical protein